MFVRSVIQNSPMSNDVLAVQGAGLSIGLSVDPDLSSSVVETTNVTTGLWNQAKAIAPRALAASSYLLHSGVAWARDLSVSDADGSGIGRAGLAAVEMIANHPIITSSFCLLSSAAVMGVPAFMVSGGLIYRWRSNSLAGEDRRQSSLGGDGVKLLSANGESLIKIGAKLTTAKGEYEVKGFLGQGGMATVYLVERVGDGALMVFKKMNRNMAQHKTGIRMFGREIDMTEDLTKKGVRNLVAYIDELGEPYGVFLEYLSEGDLNEKTHRHKMAKTIMPVVDSINIFSDIAVCLMDLNKNKVFHRDLKPENVFLYKDDQNVLRAKIGDLGLAKSLDARMTQAPRGTPYFMAPEQFMMKADIRSDVFALGLIMFETLTHEHPFGVNKMKDAGFEKIHEVYLSNHEPIDIDELRPDLPERLSAIIMKCLEKDPEKRPLTPDEVVIALKHVMNEMNPTQGDSTFVID